MLGSIPACTGEPLVHVIEKTLLTVYPRMYGGADVVTQVTRTGTGLSPHVRGSLVVLLRHCESDGSIPACTGEPMSVSCAFSRLKVYPRMYGGAPEIKRPAITSQGLSPHVRGSREHP